MGNIIFSKIPINLNILCKELFLHTNKSKISRIILNVIKKEKVVCISQSRGLNATVKEKEKKNYFSNF